MIGMLTGGKFGLISALFGLGVLAILIGIADEKAGSDGRLLFVLGAVGVGGGLLAAALSKPWKASTAEYDAATPKGPYDRPASLNPRYDSYMRMIDPSRDRPHK